MNEADLLKCISISGIYIAIKSIPSRMWDADKLLEVRNVHNQILKPACLYLRFIWAEAALRSIVTYDDLIKDSTPTLKFMCATPEGSRHWSLDVDSISISGLI